MQATSVRDCEKVDMASSSVKKILRKLGPAMRAKPSLNNFDDFPRAGNGTIGGNAAAKGGALVVAGYLPLKSVR
jgi:hypothetical protein